MPAIPASSVGDARDRQRDTRSDNDAGEDVAPDLIGAEPVRRRWRLQQRQQVLRIRIGGRDRRTEHREQREQNQERRANQQEQALAPRAADVTTTSLIAAAD